MDWTVTMTMTGIVLILDESCIYKIDSICCSICIYLLHAIDLQPVFFYKCQWQWHCHVGTGKCSFVKPANANGWGLESLCVAVGPGALNTQSKVIWNPSLLPPPSPHPLKQSKTLQYSAEYIRRSEYPFHSYLKPTASPAASQNTIIGSILHRSTCSIVNTQAMVIWDHLHLQQTRWVEIISASSSQPQPP